MANTLCCSYLVSETLEISAPVEAVDQGGPEKEETPPSVEPGQYHQVFMRSY